MYSVEYVDETDVYNCWNQYALTESKWLARLYYLELRLLMAFRKQKTRNREF